MYTYIYISTCLQSDSLVVVYLLLFACPLMLVVVYVLLFACPLMLPFLELFPRTLFVFMCVCMRVCTREREGVCECVYVRERHSG